MAVDLTDFVPALRREVTPPGSDIFAGVSDEVMAGYLADALWEAKLDGFVPHWVSDEDGIVTPTIVAPDAPDIPREIVTIILIYAGIRILRNRLVNQNTSFRAQAGPVEYQVESSAAAITEMLRQLQRTKDRFLELSRDMRETTAVSLIDAVRVREGEQVAFEHFGSRLAIEGTL